ncbi:MAG: hypothetical protein LBC75_10460 [Fibromonadaceae bacterium]|jgi:hypothetical protein|nr:hypothetical protein [Fibromonadaceae bacterium]
MVLRFLILATAFLLSCTEVERDNCWDEKSINYWGNSPGGAGYWDSTGYNKGDYGSAMEACLEDYPPDNTKGGKGVCVFYEYEFCITDITSAECDRLFDELDDGYFQNSCPRGFDEENWNNIKNDW